MNSALPAASTFEAIAKWAAGEAATKTPATSGSLRIVSRDAVPVTPGNLAEISAALRSEVTQMYFRGTLR